MSIKTKVTPTCTGYLHLKPVSKKVQKRVADSNKYDGSAYAYLDIDTGISEFKDTLSFEKRKEIDAGYPVIILMDEWIYRHGYVGGQSD